MGRQLGCIFLLPGDGEEVVRLGFVSSLARSATRHPRVMCTARFRRHEFVVRVARTPNSPTVRWRSLLIITWCKATLVLNLSLHVLLEPGHAWIRSHCTPAMSSLEPIQSELACLPSPVSDWQLKPELPLDTVVLWLPVVVAHGCVLISSSAWVSTSFRAAMCCCVQPMGHRNEGRRIEASSEQYGSPTYQRPWFL